MTVTSVALLARQAQALDSRLPCRRENPLLWFSDRPADLELARAHCGPCPLRGPCLAGALERREPHGVWGGEILAAGAIIPVKRPRGRPRGTGRCRDRSTGARSDEKVLSPERAAEPAYRR